MKILGLNVEDCLLGFDELTDGEYRVPKTIILEILSVLTISNPFHGLNIPFDCL